MLFVEESSEKAIEDVLGLRNRDEVSDLDLVEDRAVDIVTDVENDFVDWLSVDFAGETLDLLVGDLDDLTGASVDADGDIVDDLFGDVINIRESLDFNGDLLGESDVVLDEGIGNDCDSGSDSGIL